MFKDEKILVIDDEQVILDAVTRIASDENIKVDSETNARTALKMLSHKNYSLVLCDILMPEMDGFSVLEEIQSMKVKTPVIMITGFSTDENAVKSLYKGAVDFIPKPFTFEEIKSAISRGLQFSRLYRKIDEAKSGKREEPIAHVPCPPKYYRLGNISWVHLESEGIASLGVSDLFLETIEKVKSIEFMEKDAQLNQGESCANFLTDDELEHHFLSPISGRILRVNERLLEDINLLEKDPYFEGWVYKLIPADLEHDIKFLVPCASDRM
jgi:CheY-like chemotaxis protein/glycine cleavage system H lipoate-binding protein